MEWRWPEGEALGAVDDRGGEAGLPKPFRGQGLQTSVPGTELRDLDPHCQILGLLCHDCS